MNFADIGGKVRMSRGAIEISGPGGHQGGGHVIWNNLPGYTSESGGTFEEGEIGFLDGQFMMRTTAGGSGRARPIAFRPAGHPALILDEGHVFIPSLQEPSRPPRQHASLVSIAHIDGKLCLFDGTWKCADLK